MTRRLEVKGGDMSGNCEACGTRYAYVRQHERNVHGLYRTGPRPDTRKAKTRRPRAPGVEAATAALEAPLEPRLPKAQVKATNGHTVGNVWRRLDGFELLTLNGEDVWIAERIR